MTPGHQAEDVFHSHVKQGMVINKTKVETKGRQIPGVYTSIFTVF